MTRRETVHSKLTQEERRRVQRDTLHGRAVAEEGMVSGRFAAREKSTVTGAAAIEYAQPPNSYWASDPIGLEPGLGYSIEDHPAVGEAHEISASLGDVRSDDLGQPPSLSGEASAPTGDSFLSRVETPRRSSQKRKGRRR